MTLQEEKELLLRVVTKLAAKLIGEGGFVPFGATLGPGRNVKLLMPKGWKENATRDELEACWSRELKKAHHGSRVRDGLFVRRRACAYGQRRSGARHIYPSRAGRVARGRDCLSVPEKWSFRSETWYSDERRDRVPRVRRKPAIATCRTRTCPTASHAGNLAP